MGQKTHPKGFRLVTTQKHLSQWYVKKNIYPSLIEEDFLIRSKIDQFFQEFLSISKIEINRIQQETKEKEYVNVTVYALFPRAKDMYKKVSKFFSENIKSEDQKNLSLLNNSKGNLKRFTSLVLKKTIRNLIRLLQIKTGKNYYIGVKFLKCSVGLWIRRFFLMRIRIKLHRTAV